jgi:hypothetical protein
MHYSSPELRRDKYSRPNIVDPVRQAYCLRGLNAGLSFVYYIVPVLQSSIVRTVLAWYATIS